MHGLRATTITMLQEHCFSDSAIMLRTGHKDVNSLKSYANLRGQLGVQQFQAIFDRRDAAPAQHIDMLHQSTTEHTGVTACAYGVNTVHAPGATITINVYNNAHTSTEN